MVYTSGRVASSRQSWTFSPHGVLDPATTYTCTVGVGGAPTPRQAAGTAAAVSSLPQPFFTSLAAEWGSSLPMWTPPCPRGGGADPDFAFFHNTLAVPAAEDDTVVSALAFATAEGPVTLPPYGCCGEAEQGGKLLAGYKLFVAGEPGPRAPPCRACHPASPCSGFAPLPTPPVLHVDLSRLPPSPAVL